MNIVLKRMYEFRTIFHGIDIGDKCLSAHEDLCLGRSVIEGGRIRVHSICRNRFAATEDIKRGKARPKMLAKRNAIDIPGILGRGLESTLDDVSRGPCEEWSSYSTFRGLTSREHTRYVGVS